MADENNISNQNPSPNSNQPPEKKPISEAKLLANRRNGARSQGPVTPEGKRRSSLNAFRSGLTGQIVAQTPEELAVFQKHCDEFLAELRPEGPTERYLATMVATDMYRMLRAQALENGLFAQGFRDHVDEIDSGHPEVDAALAASQTFVEHAHSLSLLTTYEGRITRRLDRNRAELKALQAERKDAFEKARDRASMLVEHAESKGETYQPAADFTPAADHGGFVFSAPELNLHRSREKRFDAAWRYHHRDKSRDPEPDLDPIADMEAA